MKAVLFATHQYGDGSSERCAALCSLLGKPFIVHVVERLVVMGVRDLRVVLHHEADAVEELLEAGERWGVEIEYYLVKDPELPLSSIAWSWENWDDESVLFAQGHILPVATDEKMPVDRAVMGTNWTGWATLSSAKRKQLEPRWSWAALSDFSKTELESIEVETVLSAESAANLMEAVHYVLDNPSTLLFPSGTFELRPGVWASSGTNIDAGARIEGPVFLGPNVQVMKGCILGPHVAVESGSIIDAYTEVRGSLVLSNSYVGQHLHLEDTVVDQAELLHLKHGTTLQIEDEIILAPLREDMGSHLAYRFVERSLAVLLLILLSPVALWGVISRVMRVRKAVALPSQSKPESWKLREWIVWDSHLGFPKPVAESLTSFVLGLFMVAMGEISFVGMPPRSKEEVLHLPRAWRFSYLSSKLGVVAFADTVPHEGCQEALYASEAFYAVHAGPRFDAWVVGKYLINRLMRGSWPHAADGR